jgi:hypothetical protein
MNLLLCRLRLLLDHTNIVLGNLCSSFIHKSIQAACTQYGLSQIQHRIIFSTVTICLDLFSQGHPPLEELFWRARIIFVNLHNVGFGILAGGVNWDLERTQLCVIFLVLPLGLHSELRLQFIIQKLNLRRKRDDHNLLFYELSSFFFN